MYKLYKIFYIYVCVYVYMYIYMASLLRHLVKNPPAMQKT